jgi:hypothetical protein
LTGQDIGAINTIYSSGLIDQRTALEILRRGEVLSDDIELDEVLASSEAEQLKGMEQEMQKLEAQAAAQPEQPGQPAPPQPEDE